MTTIKLHLKKIGIKYISQHLFFVILKQTNLHKLTQLPSMFLVIFIKRNIVLIILGKNAADVM